MNVKRFKGHIANNFLVASIQADRLENLIKKKVTDQTILFSKLQELLEIQQATEKALGRLENDLLTNILSKRKNNE